MKLEQGLLFGHLTFASRKIKSAAVIYGQEFVNTKKCRARWDVVWQATFQLKNEDPTSFRGFDVKITYGNKQSIFSRSRNDDKNDIIFGLSVETRLGNYHVCPNYV